ncbi:MAG: respiratory nitrate reductase subunit gamma [Gammaproteobacteria bacterium]|uniref:nitrate reductase (quinone) n=1 Tax=Marinobacter nitratireducens TaxID=1137280 RepID=A0A072N3J3_9GAMM|nr:respiratory nitrate reductase subunit gamma [Marinobacter nitratireducens]KEF31827.1 Respiratory nitrate reductase gamma chain [Marinobacter nitratireducens]TNE77138.1 MAG: respiratory nitrate reductase subunit gamma [Gammaproteobacteria bacterium]TNE99185.1 MAG: respiratory nitrate reductase subunit gamma [Gammaproteobacteria bacterium]
MSYINTLLFGIYPYIALIVLFVGTWARYDHGQFTWKAQSSQMLRKKNMVMASVLFHVGVLVIFFGHFVGLLTPHWAYEWLITPGQKQVMAIAVGGVAGIMALIGGAMLAWRRMTDPRVQASSTTADNLIILILVVQVVLGLLTILPTLGHLDGSTMLKFSGWAQGILTFQGGSADYLAGVHWIYKTHIFLGLTIFVLFPFTRLVHILSVPAEYLTRRYQVVRKRA